MSVINTMLKDLDKRAQPHELENLHVAPVQYQTAPPSRLPWYLLAVVTLALVAVAVFGWERLTTKNIDKVESSPVGALETESIAADNVAEQPSLPVAVSAGVNDGKPVSSQGKVEHIASDNGPLVTKNDKQAQAVKAAAPVEPVKTEPELKATPELTTDDEALSASVTPEGAVGSGGKAGNPAPASSQGVKAKTVESGSGNSGSMAVTEVKLSDEQLAQKRFIVASEAESKGLLEDAIVYYSEALVFNPKLHQARKQLAALYYGKGRLDLAIELLRQGVALFPGEYDYLLLTARVQQASGEKQQALTTLSRIPDSSSLVKQKWLELSTLAQELKDFVLAERGYRQLLSMETNQARWWMGLAYSLDAQGKYGAAKEAYNQAIVYKSVPQKGLSAQAADYIENRLAQLGEIE
ncbi:tetratricopeptide repeat protein [Shewanella atlantica]|uniref:tetratricopeptide repeat protein n=1 Tax=Shewanella atlantica TaxID=271099 RepID=UPI003734FA3A